MATPASNAKPSRIVQITACADSKYVNVYGLDEQGNVWRWKPVKPACWVPYSIKPREGGRDANAGWDG